MSQLESLKSICQTRPPRPDPSRLRNLRLTRLAQTEEIQTETCNLASECQNIPTYIDVLSDKSSVKDVPPARPPPTVLKRSFLSQSTETQDVNGHAEMSDIRYTETPWHNGNDEATVEDPTYVDSLPNERTSTEESPKPKCPTRPPPPHPSRLRNLRLTRIVDAEEIQTETCNLAPESPNIPTYIDVLSDKSSVKDVPPARPPPTVLKRSFLSQSTETQDVNGHAEMSDIRYTETPWHNGNDEATVEDPTYVDSLPNERTSTEESPKPKCPTRPPPPHPSRLRNLRLTRIVDAEEIQTETCDLPPESPNIPTYIDVLSDKTSAKDVPPVRPPPPVVKRSSISQSAETKEINGHAETSDIRYTKNGNNEATVDGSTYADIPPNERSPINHTSPVKVPPRRPVFPPRLSAIHPRKPLLCQSRSAEPTEHVYESIDDVLSQDENGARRLPSGLVRQGRLTSYYAWSERSSVDGDSTARELDILLEWWKSIGGLENPPVDSQGETKPLISVAQRLKTAMRLYELLLVQRCTDLLNHITELHCTADSLVKSSKKARVAKLTGGTTGAVGGVTIAAGLALAPLTFGASLVATGVGIGIVAAGGVTGASASFSKKMKLTQLKEKVERIINNFKLQIEDILACLRFIDIGMEHLRMQDDTKLMEMGASLEKIGRVAKEMENINSIDAISECFDILHGFEFYYSEEDYPRSKSSNRELSQKFHEVADKLKECVDQLIRFKNLFHSVEDD